MMPSVSFPTTGIRFRSTHSMFTTLRYPSHLRRRSCGRSMLTSSKHLSRSDTELSRDGIRRLWSCGPRHLSGAFPGPRTIGSSVVSIDLPKPLFYDSSYSDEVRVGHRLRDLVQIPAAAIGGQTTRSGSRVLEALKHAEDIASLVPAWGLKHVPGSLLALIHAVCDYEQLGYSPIKMGKFELRIKSLTDAVPMLIEEKEPSDIPRQAIDDLKEFAGTIEVITATCRQTLSQGRLERFTDTAEKVIADLPSLISNAIEQFTESETIKRLKNVVRAKPRVKRKTVSEKTKNPNLSTHAKPSKRAECLEGTRTVVLGEIFAWLKDTSGARLFWLNGIAGSGKSAVARSASIRAALLADHIVVAIFFAQFGYAGLYDPSSVFQTLAFQFSLLDIGYKERISEVIGEHPDIFERDLRFQYEKLIVGPLDAIRRPHSCILIILDGLDECEPREMTAVLKVLLADDVDHPRELKILTAGRPEAHLRRIFGAQSDLRSLSLEEVETENDIQHYLRTFFERPPTLMVNSFTVTEEIISELAKRAGNSFIYASTIVRFVFDEPCQDPQRRVNFLLNHRVDPEEHPYTRLDALFLGILQQALPLGACLDEKRRLRTVLSLLVCFREPFPMNKMEAFYDLEPGDVERALRHLHSLVQVPNLSHRAPRIHHRSFTDFIIDPARCPDRNLVVDIGSTEKRIFNKLFTPLMKNAGTTMYTHPLFSAEEEYACLYWASHLTRVKDVDESTQSHLDDQCLLRWIETMALLGMQRDAVIQIISLKGQPEADGACNRLVDLMDNAFRLLPISYDSLLIYNSALFTRVAEFQPQVVEVKPGPRLKRGDLYSFRHSSHAGDLTARSELVSSLKPLPESCYDFTRVLAWSPNSQYIAVSRVDCIEIRDALSSSIVDSFALSLSLEHMLEPKKVSCRRLAFYPDNSRIAYIAGSDRVCVRNTLARTEEFVVTGHEGGLVSTDVSPNGKLLVSTSNSGRIQVCNAENGDLLWAVDTDTKLKSTSISPNSQFIVSLSYSRNYGVQIWNANDGLPLVILPHDADSISFCPDSDQIASVDQGGLVRVWGMSQTTKEPVQEWRINAQPACLLFSPDGRHLAAAAGRNVYVLRRDTGDVATLDGHTGPVTSLTFSADGLTLASGSLDETIRLWDASSIGCNRVEKDRRENWDDELLSPRGQVVMASKSLGPRGPRGRKVGIWNTQDGTSRVLEDFSGGSPLAISDCGRYLAARSWKPERIITHRTASYIAESNPFAGLQVNTSDINCFKFFPNSTRFAVASLKVIFTWDASAFRPEVTRLVGHSREVQCIHFVPDRSRLLSRAGGEVFAWDVNTLQLVSRIGNVIPPSPVMAMEDYWIVVMPPDSGEPRRLFRLPSGYEPQLFYTKFGGKSWEVKASWSSKCILIKWKNRNALIVDLSALPAAWIDFKDGPSTVYRR
ncbi:hypothetical protein EDB84DRAFT_1508818 [Lactarius hengduanensis]|nr:hypothetical protein EDB84DRAFT_1508818 [Lactarius hengduanensis]